MTETQRPILTDHINGIRDSLAAAFAGIGGDTATIKIGCGEPPPNLADTDGFFLVIRPGAGGILWGDLSDAQRDVRFPITVMAASRKVSNREPSEHDVLVLLDVVRKHLRRDTVIIPSRTVMKVSLADDVSFFTGALQDDDAPATTYYAMDRYEIWTTPS